MFAVIGRRYRRATPALPAPVVALPPPPRPRIGLALGGGAARGFAHIGVLRALVEADLAPDIVAGTSIGAVVGGCHAAGQLNRLEAWARDLNRRRIFGLMDFAFGGSGLISGNRLRRKLWRELGSLCIETLPVRFAAVTTEMRSGHEVWLTRGPLVDALCASYALPGVFAPVKVGDRWLMDGALVNPVPVTAARALGARVVIAVNLHADVFGRGTVIQDHGGVPEPVPALDASPAPARRLTRRRRLRFLRQRVVEGEDGAPGLSSVLLDAFNITQDRIGRARLVGDPPDIAVGPRLSHIGLFEFGRAEEAIAEGYGATLRAMDQIRETLERLRDRARVG